MKKTILALSMLAMLGTSPVMSQARHRHHPTTEQVESNNDKAAADENVAFSDTTSAAAEDYDFAADADFYNGSVTKDSNPLNFSHFDNPFAWFASLFTVGAGGIVLALLIIVIMFTILFAPFIILFMILRYLLRRHNDRVVLAEKAMDAGVDVPEHMRPFNRQSDDYMWRKGVKNSAIGFGLMVMCSFWDMNIIGGIGGLLLCLGIGQMLIARTSYKKTNDDSDDSNNHQ